MVGSINWMEINKHLKSGLHVSFCGLLLGKVIKTWLPVDLWAGPRHSEAPHPSPVLEMWVPIAFLSPWGGSKDPALRQCCGAENLALYVWLTPVKASWTHKMWPAGWGVHSSCCHPRQALWVNSLCLLNPPPSNPEWLPLSLGLSFRLYRGGYVPIIVYKERNGKILIIQFKLKIVSYFRHYFVKRTQKYCVKAIIRFSKEINHVIDKWVKFL